MSSLPFTWALVPLSGGMGDFCGVGGAQIQQDASSQIVLLFLEWHKLDQAWKVQKCVWSMCNVKFICKGNTYKCVCLPILPQSCCFQFYFIIL